LGISMISGVAGITSVLAWLFCHQPPCGWVVLPQSDIGGPPKNAAGLRTEDEA